MTTLPLFDDAAPLAGGAGVNGPVANTRPQCTNPFPRPPARRRGPATSKAAARRIEAPAPALRQRVWAFIASRGAFGATDREVQAALRLSSDTEVPRRWELVRAGLVRDSGEKRKTPSGSRAIVWTANPDAVSEAVRHG